jgi:hypothetical protein
LSIIAQILEEKASMTSLNHSPEVLLISDALWPHLKQEEAFLKVSLCGESGDFLAELRVEVFKQEENPWLNWALKFNENGVSCG